MRLLFTIPIIGLFLSFGIWSDMHAQSQRIDSLEQVLDKVNDDQGKLAVYLQLVDWYGVDFPSQQGIDRCMEAAELARKLRNELALAKIQRIRGEISMEVNQSDYDTPIKYLTESTNILTKLLAGGQNTLEVNRELVIAIKNIGYNHWLRGKLYESMVYYDSAIRFTEAVVARYGPDSLVMKALGQQYNSKGAILWAQGEYDNSLTNYLKAQEILGGLGLHRNVSLTYTNIGLIFTVWGQDEDARFYFRKGLESGMRSGHPFAIAYALNNLGKLHEKWENYDSALHYYSKSSEKYMEAKRMGGVGLNLNGIGTIYAKMGKVEESLAAFNNALEIAEKNDALYWIALAKMNLAKTYAQTKDYANALKCANESAAIAEGENYVEILQDNYQVISTVYMEKRDFEKAHMYLTKFYAAKDTLFTREKFEQLAKLKDQHEIEKRDQEYALLIKDRLLQAQDLKRAQTEKLALIILILMLCIVVAIFIWAQRRTTKVNVQLQEQAAIVTQQKEDAMIHAAELKKTNDIKNLLFSIVSHDLRGPLASLDSLISMLSKKIISTQEFQEMLPTVATNISQINILTDNLLYWAKGQMEGVKVVTKDFDLGEMVKEKFTWFSEFAHKKGIKLESEYGAGINVHADPYMIELVIRNLLSNAIKFCNTGDMIDIAVKPEGSHVVVQVKDSGIGIPPEYHSVLFDNTNHTTLGTQNEKGYGLGLKICKQFVELNGGKIWVESIYRKGSSFYFMLPIAKAESVLEGVQS